MKTTKGSWATAKNTKNTDEPYGRSILQGKQDLQGLVSCGGRRVFSGQIRVMQRPELVTTRRPGAATAAGLEQHGNSERKETTEEGE